MRSELHGPVATPQKERRALGPAELARAIIADCEGDAGAAVLALVRINSALMLELEALTVTRFPGAGRPRPTLKI